MVPSEDGTMLDSPAVQLPLDSHSTHQLSTPCDCKTSPFLLLPTELIQHILSYLQPLDLASTAQTCRTLATSSVEDCIWQPIVHDLAHKSISKPEAFRSFRDLYVSQHPRWFIPQSRAWISDSEPHGKLVVTRYDETNGSIVGHSVVARRSSHSLSFWEKDSDVMIHSFDPLVSLDLNRPVLKLGIDSPFVEVRPNEHEDHDSSSETRYQKEVLMETSVESGLHSSFMLCRELPRAAITEQTHVWPPLRIPAKSRTRNSSQDNFHSSGHRPSELRNVSQNNFRVRKWVEYHSRYNPHIMNYDGNILSAALGIPTPYFASNSRSNISRRSGLSIRMPEDVTTYGALPESSVIPTAGKPWQGIWCGDYSGHGCEFLLIQQLDESEARPLPEGMNWLRGWFSGGRRRRSSSSSAASFTSAVEQQVDCDDPSALEPGEVSNIHRSSNAFPFESTPDYEHVPSGRIEAIKLTGDPNVPRGEYTFIAPDIGHGGFIRVADEGTFKGARIVRSAGHVAGNGFLDDQYTPSQLIMLSHNRLAQFWEAFGHISYYTRVDIEKLMEHGTGERGSTQPF